MRVFALHEIIGQCLPEYMHGAEQPSQASAPSACIISSRRKGRCIQNQNPALFV